MYYFNYMTLNDLIDFRHLNEEVFVRVDNKTSMDLIQRLKNKYKLWKLVGERLNTSPSNIHRIDRRGIISLKMLFSIINDLSIPFESIRDKIYALKIGDGGIETPNVLPLNPSAELSSLVAHACGDGGIHSRNCRFEYTNSNKEVIDEVKRCAKVVFKFIEPYERYVQKTNTNVTKLIYPSMIGKLLESVGAPKGRKTAMEFEIPEWIMKGSKEIKKSFLQALFDDEGSAEKRFLISLSLNKHSPYENNLLLFLNQVKQLLEEFRIDSISISLRKIKDGVKGVLRISNLLRLERFAKEINFNHTKRRERLETLLKAKKRVYKKGESKEVILKELESSPLSTIEIARKIKRSRNNTSIWLRILEKEKKVKRLFITRHKTEVTWALADFEGDYIPYHDSYHAIPIILKNNPKTFNELSKGFKLSKSHILKCLRKLENECTVKITKRAKDSSSWIVYNNENS